LMHCGSCGRTCPSRQNSTVACVNGECSYNCNPGFANCDGNATNGCEANLASTTHCQRCGNQCPLGATCGSNGCCGAPRIICN
jgi:hypothetical protein